MNTKKTIIQWLEDNYGDNFCFGGKLARAIHELTGTKESVVERRARELVEAGVLQRSLVQVEGKGPRVVRYRVIKPLPQLTEDLRQNNLI